MTTVPYQWRFFRTGGFDQVLLETADDLLALEQLDKKLWAALSCPVKGVEFDPRTLELIDSDNDGHIRVPELLTAIQWSADCLKDRSYLAGAPEGVPLAAISDSSSEGERIRESARTILTHLGKPECDRITLADAENSEAILVQSKFNGDGIITLAGTDDEELQGWLSDIMLSIGSSTDRCGDQGITTGQLQQFNQQTADWLAWHDQVMADPLWQNDADRSELLTLWEQVRPKIDDFFLRCSMAGFDPRATIIMNSSEENLIALSSRNLTETIDDMAALPLAAVSPAGILKLDDGLNPAWQNAIQRVSTSVITPLLGELQQLSLPHWNQVKQALQQYELWWNAKPESNVATLGIERLRQWQPSFLPALQQLIDQDLAMQPAFEARVEVERLTRYCRDLLTFANNFVSFKDFYSGRGKGIFQSGTLFLDGRSFELCIAVSDVAKHAQLANLSRVYLVYCDCIRNGGAEKMTVVAGITDGDADQLLVGRNGILYDRQGHDWDATVVRILEHPISIRQAFWDPYKRIAKMVSEQLQKIAAARSKAAEDKATVNLMQTGQKKDDKAVQQPFDVGKFAGIFAAIGLAIGAIGTAIVSVLTGFLKLNWWQMPLALLGVMLLISGPSMIIAWFKLRQRNLGRLLDANGWAVNTRAKINIPFGASLTGLATLPPGASRSLSDPFADKKRPWKSWLFLMLLLLAVVICWKSGLIPVKISR